ncbi:hypothetical protein L345_01452, partial [Ophiophagus hannah]
MNTLENFPVFGEDVMGFSREREREMKLIAVDCIWFLHNTGLLPLVYLPAKPLKGLVESMRHGRTCSWMPRILAEMRESQFKLP